MATKEGSAPPRWQALKYPSEERFIEIAEKFPDLDGLDFYELPGWIRLGWPDEQLWHRCNRTEEREKAREQKQREPQPWPVARKPWVEVLKIYPLAKGLPDDQQDLYRVLRYWPDCFGRPIVEVDLLLTEGICINNLTYGPGKHRVPDTVAQDLRYIDATARQHFIDQFIPKKHQDKVIATLSMKGGGEGGEIKE